VSTPGELLEALGRQARARLPGAGATRTYRGRSVDELIPLIQRELGAEAIVVRRREGLTGGVLGFFQHPFVEIEAMPGGPGVDVYDEPEDLADLAQEPAAPSPGAATYARPSVRATFGATAAQAPAPARADASAPSPTASPAQTPARQSPPAPARPGVPPRPALGYWPAASSAAPAPTPGTPAPFPPRQEPSPAVEAGSAYVTAHLAALARANRARAGRRDPGLTLPERPAPTARVRPQPPAPAPRRAASVSAQLPSEGAGRRTPHAEPVPEREPLPWSGDSQELEPQELSELFAPVGERQRREPRAAAGGERRTVAPGSHGRARAGVAKSLQRYGISEELAYELIDGASAHALALAPRAGLAQGVRATLAQRIPVAPPLPSKGAAIVVVGAGGAGKTTCCAALLGAYRRSSSLPAKFATITLESEREELRMILSPYISKPTPARTQRAQRALDRARKEGMTVLDTPNLSPSDRSGIRELAGLLAEVKPERVVIALPATLGATAAAQLLAGLRPLGANSLAVTHADETDQIGVAVEAACKFGLAPEYVLDRTRSGAWRLSRVDPGGLAARLLP
jgi:flagellar biosynthesis GTPase FlhF